MVSFYCVFFPSNPFNAAKVFKQKQPKIILSPEVISFALPFGPDHFQGIYLFGGSKNANVG